LETPGKRQAVDASLCDGRRGAESLSQGYIRSQAHAGWTPSRSKYDDGGFSGAIPIGPLFNGFFEDVRAGKVDVIVVYKVDRLTRSLADFANLVELFDDQPPRCPSCGGRMKIVDDGPLSRPYHVRKLDAL
jgi:hypothetical protein